MSQSSQDPPPTRDEPGRASNGSPRQAPARGSLAPGARIESYEIVRLLGMGGMGEVYEAVDHQLGRTVALKLIAEATSADPAFVARFRREAQLASTITHPNVAQIHAAGNHDGRPYYVMEYVEGRSLAQRLAEGERLAGRATLDFLLQACRGLQAAWEAGVVHRDIKPSNLILTPDGTLKIVDFGLARSVAKVDGNLTEPDLIVGTPTYTAPEQALGLEVDHRADIYSLGASFYHLFSGTPVFEGESALGVLVRHVEETPQPLARVRPSVPTAVGEVVDRMLAKSPEDRWQRYEELIAALERVRGGGSAEVSGPSSSPAPAWYRQPAPGVIVILVALGVGLLLVLVLAGGREPEPAAAVAVEPFDVDSALEAVRAHPLMSVAWSTQTLASMRQLTTALEIYYAEEGMYPPSLEVVREFYGIHPRELVDAWRSPIELTVDGDGYTLRSLGPDREAGTSDDLVIEDGFVTQGGPPPPA